MFSCCVSEADVSKEVELAPSPVITATDDEKPASASPTKEAPAEAAAAEEPAAEATKVVAAPDADGKFTVELKTTGTLGLGIESADAECLVVSDITPGSVVDEYNRTAAEGTAILSCDRILSVNSAMSGKDIMAAVTGSSEPTLKFELQRCKEFEALLDKKGGALGLNLALKEKSNMIGIRDVEPGGAALAWNEANADKKIKKHDKILAVDGVKTAAKEMIGMMKEKSSFTLTMVTWA